MQTLKRKIMTRIYTIFVLRKVFNPVSFKVLMFLASSFVIISLVSLGSILGNMQSITSLDGALRFSVSAFFNTDRIVQFLTIAIVLIAVGLFVDAAKQLTVHKQWSHV